MHILLVNVCTCVCILLHLYEIAYDIIKIKNNLKINFRDKFGNSFDLKYNWLATILF